MEDEDNHLFEQSSNQQPNIWIQPTDQIDQKSSKNNITDNCQLISTKCNYDCCYTNPIQLSSSIVHIDENDSDDEYLDAVNYETTDDLNDNLINDQTNLKNLINSQSTFDCISSFDLNKQNCLNNVHTDPMDYLTGQLNTEQFNDQLVNLNCTDHNRDLNKFTSSCTFNSLVNSKTSTVLSTTKITSNNSSFNSQQLNLIKCHCRISPLFVKQRPLSLSSISSSSSSCCSLSRNNSLALSDLKKPYLASIESLGDDELNGSNISKYQLDDRSSSGISSGCQSSSTNSSTEPSVHSTCSCCVLRSNSNLSLVRSASTNSNKSQCKCNHLDAYELNQQQTHHTLSQMDRVIMEIVQTETAYVKDLKEIIDGYFVYLNKKLFADSTDTHLPAINDLKKSNYESDDDMECNDLMITNTYSTHSTTQSQPPPSSNSILKSSINAKRNISKTKLTSSNLNNQFDHPHESSVQSITNQTSHTLPKSTKQQNLIKFKSHQTGNSQFYLNSIHNEKILDEAKLINLFGNLNDIFKFNSELLNQLMQCGFEPVQIAQCFIKNQDGFHVYSQYCINYPKQVETLTDLNRNNFTNQLLKIRQTELGHSLPLGSYLLKPIQRILKYSLLLNNMVKHFESEHIIGQDQTDNADNDQNSEQQQTENVDRSLRNALAVMQSIATNINTMKKKHEHAVRVQEIQSLLIGWPNDLGDLGSFGELVAENTFKLFGNKTFRHLFLFDKMLLVVKKKDDSLFAYKTHILCSNLMLIESIRNEPLSFHVIPFNNPKIQFTFQAKNLDQKREWCLLIKNAILESYQAIPSHAKQIVLGLGQKNQTTESKHHKVFPVNLNRKLSAPEYLEKRCKAQQKSLSNSLTSSSNLNSNFSSNVNHNLSIGMQFSSLQKGFKLRKSIKKGVHLIGGRNSTTLNPTILNNDSNRTDESNKIESIEYKDISGNKMDNKNNLNNNDNDNDAKVEREADLISSYNNEKDILLDNDTDKLVNHHHISSCLSSTSLTTTNDSGVGSTTSVCCCSQLRLTTPISLGSSIASIESNATTTTANSYSYSSGCSQISGSSNSKLTSLHCSIENEGRSINQSADNRSSNDDFNELLNDHESNVKTNNSIKFKSFKGNKRCVNRCMDNSNRFGFNRTLDSPSTSLTKFNESRANYLNYPQSKFYNGHRQTKYHQLNSDEIDFRPHNQVRRVQSFNIGNKNLVHYSSCNKSFALNGCTSGSNSSAILQHTVSFRKSPNVELALAKLRHLHRRPAAREKQLYKQQQLQKLQQLNELKLQGLNLDNDDCDIEQKSRSNENESNNELKNEETSEQTILKDNNQKQQDSSSDDDKTSSADKKSQITKFMENHSKLNKTKDSNSMEELSPTLPAIWLKNHQEQHFINKVANLKKGGSLPRNFEACL